MLESSRLLCRELGIKGKTKHLQPETDARECLVFSALSGIGVQGKTCEKLNELTPRTPNPDNITVNV